MAYDVTVSQVIGRNRNNGWDYNLNILEINIVEPKKEIKMTKEEAKIICANRGYSEILGLFEALGLIKFKEEKKDERQFLIKTIEGKEVLVKAYEIIKLVKEWELCR